MNAENESTNKKILYIEYGEYIEQSDKYLPTDDRNSMVHSLIESYGLLEHMHCITPSKASNNYLTSFHSSDYIELVEKASDGLIDEDEQNEELVEAGLKYDCPVKDGLYDYCQRIAGGTIHAAKLLGCGAGNIAIHWMGGWHHAQRSNAAGFCYVNDCVLGIIELRKYFSKVLYVDIDVHHGDGVQDAFYGTNKVLTFSIHRCEPGFYPGTGLLNDSGNRNGKNYSINLPFNEGLQDTNFCNVLDSTLTNMFNAYAPEAVVLQMGADALHNDPMQSFSLTEKSYLHCVSEIISWNIPILILGGGGYNETNTARCWTAVTGLITGQKLNPELPDHDFFLKYGPGYELSIVQPLKKDTHSTEYIDKLSDATKNKIINIKPV